MVSYTEWRGEYLGWLMNNEFLFVMAYVVTAVLLTVFVGVHAFVLDGRGFTSEHALFLVIGVLTIPRILLFSIFVAARGREK